MASLRLESRNDETQWARLSELIAEHMGLYFSPERFIDLQRGLAGAADEFGFDDIAACADWLLSTPLNKAQLQVLATHLTIGETYFFREKKTFDVLANSVFPELIHARLGREQRLRLWSAACCSGEEAYSLAILLHQVLPDLADWHVTILATDINPVFLRKAVAGSYGEWSFRDAPSGFKERYFNRTEDGRYAVRPEIKKLVTFEHVNLVEDSYPSLATDTNAMDLIFCRNVLMYFTPAQTRKVIGNLHHALMDGGWLAVSPSEASQALFPQFVTQNFPGVILYQKSDAGFRTDQSWSPASLREAGECVAPVPAMPMPWASSTTSVRPPEPVRAPSPETPPLVESCPAPCAVAASLYEQGRYGEAADTLLASFAGHTPGPDAFSVLARALANQGRLADALKWCDRWIAADKMDAAGHYLRAVVLLEHGHPDEARGSLQRALYLEPNFVLAHFALGSLARSRDKRDEADKHFVNTLELLGRLQPHDVLPESDGLTAGRLTETITAMTAPGNTR
jgi:chemotaxis protein methyltransferase CheR